MVLRKVHLFKSSTSWCLLGEKKLVAKVSNWDLNLSKLKVPFQFEATLTHIQLLSFTNDFRSYGVAIPPAKILIGNST